MFLKNTIYLFLLFFVQGRKEHFFLDARIDYTFTLISTQSGSFVITKLLIRIGEYWSLSFFGAIILLCCWIEVGTIRQAGSDMLDNNVVVPFWS